MASPADSFSGGGGKSRSPGRNNLEALGAGEAGAGDPLPGDPPPRRFTPLGDAAVRKDDRLANLEATSSGVSSISSTQLTESCFSTTPLTAGRGGESGAGDAAGEGGESGAGDAERPESPDDVRARIGGRSI